ncbi:hypothetical protein Lal_00033712 [Lupinus albus]|nr:hypothetical protein Lal_00033712 [Lupinus albus]
MRKDPKFGGGAGGTYEVAKNQTQRSPSDDEWIYGLCTGGVPMKIKLVLVDQNGLATLARGIGLNKDKFSRVEFWVVTWPVHILYEKQDDQSAMKNSSMAIVSQTIYMSSIKDRNPKYVNMSYFVVIECI